MDDLFAFILEIDKSKQITRQTYISDGSRKENDAEHAWHLAVMVYLLKDYANEPVDVSKAMMMALVHDLVEIDAGDTYAYDEKAHESKAERENAAANRLFAMTEKGKELELLWREFEALSSPEARFVKALDNIQPLMLNHATGGKAWKEHRVSLEQILKRNEVTPSGSRKLWDYAREHFIAPHVGKEISE